MKFFISWSGEASHQVALVLKKWLPRLVHGVKPFVSSEDIAKGTNGLTRIAKELTDSSFGVICLSHENLHSQWINFESGALAKSVDGRVWTYLSSMKVKDVEGPLATYQHTLPTKGDTLKLIKEIHKAADTELSGADIEDDFNTKWPKMEADLKAIKIPGPVASIPAVVKQAIRLVSVLVKPSTTVARGLTLKISYQIDSTQDLPGGIWLGASFNAGGKLYNSVSEDKRISISNGIHYYDRTFKIPADAPLGDQKLGTNIWFGVVGNSKESLMIGSLPPTPIKIVK